MSRDVSMIRLSFFIPILKFTIKISPVRVNHFKQGFRAIALHHLPIVCRSSGTSILEYIGKYFKFRIEKKETPRRDVSTMFYLITILQFLLSLSFVTFIK